MLGAFVLQDVTIQRQHYYVLSKIPEICPRSSVCFDGSTMDSVLVNCTSDKLLRISLHQQEHLITPAFTALPSEVWIDIRTAFFSSFYI